ncbi:uncharacterized protein BYT42DRAFT_583641 [Radiomyces spectabilis]|uniref:uncharacterized protein n=1 Tax=Radiomyces spectabilis TaxID=64574 RepID=UPI00221FC1D2|nr:uncharacterized protein BYT42DRAFT_583641 [Radiomyces spectabilis]KAI8369247.1 hypothetical protein BYT42DRAFT_583641 [Radiomyces spectabilis]
MDGNFRYFAPAQADYGKPMFENRAQPGTFSWHPYENPGFPPGPTSNDVPPPPASLSGPPSEPWTDRQQCVVPPSMQNQPVPFATVSPELIQKQMPTSYAYYGSPVPLHPTAIPPYTAVMQPASTGILPPGSVTVRAPAQDSIPQAPYPSMTTEAVNLPTPSLTPSTASPTSSSTISSPVTPRMRRKQSEQSPQSEKSGDDNTDDETRRQQFLERNRQAALKCRQRKKEWLSRLQYNVETLSVENNVLQQEATMLREEILNLKTMLLAHKNCPHAQANGVNGLDNAMAVPPPAYRLIN